MTSAFSWQNSCQPLPRFLLYSKTKFISYSRYLLSSYFCILVLYVEKDIIFGCQFQKVLQIFIEPFNFSFFCIIGWGKDLDYCGTKWLALEMNRDHSVIFEIAPKYCILDSFVGYEGYSISLRVSCPQQQITGSSKLNSPIPVHFISLILKMSMFNLPSHAGPHQMCLDSWT